MSLEKYDDAIAEYLETTQASYRKIMKQAKVSQEQIEEQCKRAELDIKTFLNSNEPYGQLLLDLNHIKNLTNNMYSLTEYARKKSPMNPSYVIQSWLRDTNTLEVLRLWEKENNSTFNDSVAKSLIDKTKEPSFTLTAKVWIEKTNAKGIISKQGNGGGTYAYHEIAIDFIMWAFPEKRYQLSKMIIAKSFMIEGK